MKPEASKYRLLSRVPPLAIWIAVGFVARLAAAALVQSFVDRKRTLCVFPDTTIYWALGRAIARGEPYVVSQWGVPHYALRTPGYPVFLAMIQAIFGSRKTARVAARLVQSAIGASCVFLVHRLVARIFRDRREGACIALAAAAWTAIDPYAVGMSVLLLSEALFMPLMLLVLWGSAAIWDEISAKRRVTTSVWIGLATAAAVLARPSWLPFVPIAEAARWIFGRGKTMEKARESAVILFGFCMVMLPWWIRTEKTTGRFAPTAVWVGASLYDGLNPFATGESDMRFLDRAEFRVLDETRQDEALRHSALDFARANPAAVARLAAVKFGRFWSLWPNAANLSSPLVMVASSVVVLPVFACAAFGLWESRRDARAIVLLAGPVFMFMILHMIFVSSVRYRIPGMIPAFGLAGLGLSSLVRNGRRTIE